MYVPRCQVLGVITSPSEKSNICRSVCSVMILWMCVDWTERMESTAGSRSCLSSFPQFALFKMPRAAVRSTRHHTAAGFSGEMLHSVFPNYHFHFAANNASHNTLWPNIQFYLNQCPCIGCSQTDKQSTQLKAIVSVPTAGCWHKKFKIFKPPFIYITAIHITFNGSSISARVRATDSNR
jgi:hypothetical protein